MTRLLKNGMQQIRLFHCILFKRGDMFIARRIRQLYYDKTKYKGGGGNILSHIFKYLKLRRLSYNIFK